MGSRSTREHERDGATAHAASAGGEGMTRCRFVTSALGMAVVLGSAGSAQVTERVSVSTGGAQGNAGSGLPTISADGRWVVFVSSATNLVTGDTNGFRDVFVRDRQSGTTELVSVSTGGTQGNANSGLHGLSISPDGI